MNIYKDHIGESLGLSPLYLPELDIEWVKSISTNTISLNENHPFVGGALQRQRVVDGTHNLLNSTLIIDKNKNIKIVSLDEYYNNKDYENINSKEGYRRRGKSEKDRKLPPSMKGQNLSEKKNGLKGDSRTEMQKSASESHSKNWFKFGVTPTNKGETLSEDHKRALRKPKKSMSFKEYKCPHCKKTGRGNSMVRWHMDNCRYK